MVVFSHFRFSTCSQLDTNFLGRFSTVKQFANKIKCAIIKRFASVIAYYVSHIKIITDAIGDLNMWILFKYPLKLNVLNVGSF
jgi:hypothetical protein